MYAVADPDRRVGGQFNKVVSISINLSNLALFCTEDGLKAKVKADFFLCEMCRALPTFGHFGV